ncbi:MAG: HAD-IA family hydrolase [Lachnospiraceae bacterium]|nr:HAD-IA family hydrolase [Lachnospiraceae bacterium]
MKRKKYQAVIFDLDGTLLNTLEDLMNSVNYALKSCNMPERSYEEIRHFVGNGIERLLKLSVPGGTDNPQFERAFALFKEHYGKHCNDKTDLYPGIRELLDALRRDGFAMAIVSNKYYEGVQTLKEQYFKDYLDVAIGEREGIRKKPAPDTVLTALKELHVSKENAVYVGDSEVDIETAANVGMDCITVSWGFRTRKEQEEAGAKVFAESPMEVLGVLYY